jgi:uncharacterized membrane protein YgcG
MAHIMNWLHSGGVDGRQSREGIICRDVPQDATTHYQMGGGKIGVDDSMLKKFLKIVAESLDMKEQNSLIERPRSVFPFMCDYDAIQPLACTESELLLSLNVLTQTLRQFYPDVEDSDLTAYVFRADPKPAPGTDADMTPCIKTGFHIIYPQILTKRPHALTIRKALISQIKSRFGQRLPPSNTVENVWDDCIYKANGLRMVYAHKFSKCPFCCKGRRDTSCMTCKGSNVVDDGRPYTPFLVVRSDMSKDEEELHRLNTDRFYCLVKATIRRPLGVEESGFCLPEGYVLAPGAEDPEKEAAKGKRKRKENTETQYEADEGVSGWWSKTMIPIDETTQIFQDLREFVNKRMGSQYSETVVDSVYVSKQRKCYTVKVSGKNSTYCMNKGGCHNSNSIYFRADKDRGMTQMCYKRTPNSRHTVVECKDWRSVYQRLDSEMEKRLFQVNDEVSRVKYSSRESRLMQAMFPTPYECQDESFALDLRSCLATFSCQASRRRAKLAVALKSRTSFSEHPLMPGVPLEDLDRYTFTDFIAADNLASERNREKMRIRLAQEDDAQAEDGGEEEDYPQESNGMGRGRGRGRGGGGGRGRGGGGGGGRGRGNSGNATRDY